MTDLPERKHAAEPMSQAMEDYLKCIYRLEEKLCGSVPTQDIAQRMEVSPPSVTHMLKRLAARGLVVYERYHGVELTSSGREVAREMVRHHRLLELYLTRALGFGETEVHAEAERLEHFISEALEDRIDAALGRPTCDPHGSPIPLGNERAAASGDDVPLSSLGLYIYATIVSFPTAKELEGLATGQSVVLLGRPPASKLHVRIGLEESLIEPRLADRIVVRVN